MNELVPKFQHTRAWLLAGLVAVFLRGLPNLRYPIGVDQAAFCVIGQRILRGQLPYRDVWDIKPPGIFYIYALIVKAFGPVMWSIGVIDILWLLVVSCCIFFFARRYLGAQAAALAMVFNASRHCRQGYIHAAQAETFMMLCVFGAWFLLQDESSGTAGARVGLSRGKPRPYTRLARCFAAGLLMGAAFWLKYTAIVFFPFILLLPFLDFSPWDYGLSRLRMEIPWKDWLARMSLVAAGLVLAFLGMIGYLWIVGAWPAFIETQLEVLPRFAAIRFPWSPSYTMVWALRQSQNNLGFWTEIMGALSLLIAWRRRELRFLAPVLLLALAGYICAAMQRRFHYYYFETCYPYFSMFWGYACVKTWEGFQYACREFAQRGWKLARALLWVVLAGLVFSLFSEESIRVVQQYGFLADWWQNPELSYKVYWYQLPHDRLSEQLRVINFLKKQSGPKDEVFVWGFASLISFLAQRQNSTRFVCDHPLTSTWGPVSWRQEFVRALEARPPRYFVVERHDSIAGVTGTVLDSEQYLRFRVYPPLTDLLNRAYAPAVNYTDFEVYELKKSPESDVQITKSRGQD